MEREIQCRDHGIRLQNSHPGRWWGFFHVLDYHYYWRHARRALHGKDRRGRKHRGHKPCCATPKTISFSCETGQGQDETEHLLERPSIEANPLREAPASATRELLPKDEREEKIHQDWILSFLLRRHHRTDSVLDEIKAEWTDPFIILHDGADTPIPKLRDLYSLRTGEELGGGKRAHLFERGEEAKRNLMEFGQGEKNLQQHDEDEAEKERVEVNMDVSHQTSIRKARFTKSRSFPVADASGVRHYRPITLKHKQSEMWSFPKGEKPATIGPGPRLASSDLLQNHDVQSASSSGNSHLVKAHGWNQTVMNQIKRIKRRIRRAFKEERIENAQADARLDRTSPADTKEISENSEHRDGENWTDVSEPHQMERTSSIHESLDRYAQLFENAYGKAPKLHHSDSLKLTNEDRNSSGGHTSKSFRRRLSLPDPETLSFLLGAVSSDAVCSDMRAMKDGDFCMKTEYDSASKLDSSAISSNPDGSALSHDALEVEFLEDIKEEEEEGDDDDDEETSTELRSGAVVSSDQQTIEEEEEEGGVKLDVLSSVCSPKPSPKDGEATAGESSPSNGWIHLEEPGSHANLPGSSVPEASSVPCEAKNNTVDHFLQTSHSDKKDEVDFNYVSHLLNLSGISEREQFERWQTAEQPLNPKLLDDFEDCAADRELGCSDEDVGAYGNRRLLFDSVNEALLEIFERSSAYFPKAFSFTTNVKPIPKGRHMIEEVWERVNRRRTRPERDQTLDEVIAGDVWKGDGWSNLQWEGECVALELEDWILDDLLDEVLSP